MALIRSSSGSGGSSDTIDYNYVKKIVDNNAHTYEWTPYSSRASLNAGGIYVDSENGMVYTYLDMTAIQTQSPTSYRTVFVTSPTTAVIAPCNTEDKANQVLRVHSTTATNSPVFNIYVSGGKTYVGVTKDFTSGEMHVIWGAWSINTV